MGGGVQIVCSSKTEDQSWMGGGEGGDFSTQNCRSTLVEFPAAIVEKTDEIVRNKCTSAQL